MEDKLLHFFFFCLFGERAQRRKERAGGRTQGGTGTPPHPWKEKRRSRPKGTKGVRDEEDEEEGACAMGDYGDVYMRKEAAGPPGRTKAQNRATVQQLKLVSKTSLCRADATTLNLICPVFWLYVWG